MIKLQQLDKYFNKNKSNEIHVINNINLTLPQKGLVVLLGPSGSGKTTLLNVLGGLDKTQAGVIDFDGTIMNRYKSKTWDLIRNEHIGYVFQNYNLLYDQSVFDNIALSLKMVGIHDKEEINNRIDYLLDNVGMINYKRRRTANLSGGQQQRVAIARALAKNPKVIIADEPTGNLDSKNTYDIMNILRAISQTKLVVLVTHEEHIADLYADRIIKLKDGQIVSDNENISIGGVDVQLETDIYLKDLNNIHKTKTDKATFEVYSDEEIDANFDVKLIVKNKTLYIQVGSDQYTRLNLLESDSEVQVYDEHFKGTEVEEFKESDFNLETIIDDSKKTSSRSVISIKEAIRLGLNQFRGMTFLKAFLHLIMVSIAIVVGIALSLLFNAYTSDNLDFIQKPINQIEVNRNAQSYLQAEAYAQQPSIGFLNLAEKVELDIALPKVYQSRGNTVSFNYSPIPDTYLRESTIIEGRAIENQNEVVINETYAKSLLRGNYLFESLGISSLEDLLTIKLVYTVNTVSGEKEIEVDIVGISNVDDYVFYAKEETIISMVSEIAVLEVYEDQITIDGTYSEDYQTFIILDKDTNPADLSDVSFDVEEVTFSAETTFTTTEDIPDLLMPYDAVREMVYLSNYADDGGVLVYYANNPEEATTYFEENNITASWDFPEVEATYSQIKILENVGLIMFAVVFLGAAFLGTFFILRSSLFSRIYEVSVYRALGAPKSDLRRIFLVESIILTTFTSVLGYLIISFVLFRLQQMTEGYFELVKVSPLSFASGLAIIYLVNILSGIIPISNLLRKTPSEIISKYDF